MISCPAQPGMSTGAQLSESPPRRAMTETRGRGNERNPGRKDAICWAGCRGTGREQGRETALVAVLASDLRQALALETGRHVESRISRCERGDEVSIDAGAATLAWGAPQTSIDAPHPVEQSMHAAPQISESPRCCITRGPVPTDSLARIHLRRPASRASSV